MNDNASDQNPSHSDTDPTEQDKEFNSNSDSELADVKLRFPYTLLTYNNFHTVAKAVAVIMILAGVIWALAILLR